MRLTRFLLILFALILIFISVYFLTRPQKPKKLVIPTVLSSQFLSLSPTSNPLITYETDDTMYNFVLSGKSYKCSWNQNESNSDNPYSKGQIILSHKSAITVSSTQIGKNTLQMHMVFASGSAYLWQDTLGRKIGYKLTQNDYVSVDSNMSPEKRLFVAQIRDSMHFSCSKWIDNNTLFTPPKDIIFRSAL